MAKRAVFVSLSDQTETDLAANASPNERKKRPGPEDPGHSLIQKRAVQLIPCVFRFRSQ